jgi:hypothetical protein
MKKLLIKYGDVAIGAREDFFPSSDDKAYFTNFSNLTENVSFPKYTNPCELYSTTLDGSSLLLPQNPQSVNLGWWSEQISNQDGVFSTPIIMTSVANDFYSSIGITLVFDEENAIYANNINIKWYRDNEIISDKYFQPNSSNYFCANAVDYYNKIVVTFYSLNMPQNRLKLHSIEYGYGAEFSGEELQNVKLIQEISPLSDEISINTLDFAINSQRGVEFSFQDRQTVETYFDGKLKSKTFIKDFKRKSKTQWSISTEDYIGLMETTPFRGGIYENQIAKNLIADIFATAKVPYQIQDGAFENVMLSGYIPFTNCREALMQVAFAMGAAVDTSNREDVYVFKLSEDLTQTIPLSRIIQGQNFQTETKMTAFELVAHQYRKIEDEKILYEAETDGTGENIFVKFTEPIHDLSITNGEIVGENFGANYAIINAREGCVLSGKGYEHNQLIKQKKNPFSLATDTENIISIRDATLVSANNIDNLLERCYNYYINRRIVNLKIVEAKHRTTNSATKYGQKKYGTFKYGAGGIGVIWDKSVNVGDFIEAETEYLGNVRGRAIKQTFNLNGGIIIKDTVMR